MFSVGYPVYKGDQDVQGDWWSRESYARPWLKKAMRGVQARPFTVEGIPIFYCVFLGAVVAPARTTSFSEGSHYDPGRQAPPRVHAVDVLNRTMTGRFAREVRP